MVSLHFSPREEKSPCLSDRVHGWMGESLGTLSAGGAKLRLGPKGRLATNTSSEWSSPVTSKEQEAPSSRCEWLSTVTSPLLAVNPASGTWPPGPSGPLRLASPVKLECGRPSQLSRVLPPLAAPNGSDFEIPDKPQFPHMWKRGLTRFHVYM